jgi:hypothetical protein
MAAFTGDSRMSLKSINASIQKQFPLVELVRGDGYHYLILDDAENNIYETRPIMTPYTKDQSEFLWVEDARNFVADMGY